MVYYIIFIMKHIKKEGLLTMSKFIKNLLTENPDCNDLVCEIMDELLCKIPGLAEATLVAMYKDDNIEPGILTAGNLDSMVRWYLFDIIQQGD